MATDCIGEDAELVVRLYRWMGDNDVDGRIVFVSEPVAWTEAPETLEVLRKPAPPLAPRPDRDLRRGTAACCCAPATASSA